MADKCPVCHTEIGLWTDDPILTQNGFAGSDYKGFTQIKPEHIIEIQDARKAQEIDAGIVEEERTVFSNIDVTQFSYFLSQYIEEIRESTEKLLITYGDIVEIDGEIRANLTNYFNNDSNGNYIGTFKFGTQIADKTEWTDIERDNNYSPKLPKLPNEIVFIKNIHIEELRHPILTQWIEDFILEQSFAYSYIWTAPDYDMSSAQVVELNNNLISLKSNNIALYSYNAVQCRTIDGSMMINRPVLRLNNLEHIIESHQIYIKTSSYVYYASSNFPIMSLGWAENRVSFNWAVNDYKSIPNYKISSSRKGFIKYNLIKILDAWSGSPSPATESINGAVIQFQFTLYNTVLSKSLALTYYLEPTPITFRSLISAGTLATYQYFKLPYQLGEQTQELDFYSDILYFLTHTSDVSWAGANINDFIFAKDINIFSRIISYARQMSSSDPWGGTVVLTADLEILLDKFGY